MPNFFYNEYKDQLNLFIKNALSEDIRDGDLTGNACIPEGSIKSAKLYVKTPCIIAGIELVEKIFKFYDPSIKFNKLINDGTRVNQSSTPFIVEGNARSILATERLVLNTLQRMSGIASITNNLKEKIKSFNTVLLDTRKTTPNFRYPEKWAVKIGGGSNHRMGLFDAIMIKDNHIDYSNNLEDALYKTQIYIEKLKPKKIFVVVEIRKVFEINKILKFNWIDRILLDNMNVNELKKAVRLIDGKFKTEASGGINELNIIEVAKTGVDYISLGALTHSSPYIDLSLKAN
ncbi:MAG: nicotinate-nucleotide pyrophosphorylase (carboxylating) [Candidatus Marivariicella framensis]|jgi:nicotinate-nucleotide pyrophosphorylase (carboxylating)|tara:strand:- start:1717 stop:2583 length:867 start_codon:yes stop_codon:yes gene_type:complete